MVLATEYLAEYYGCTLNQLPRTLKAIFYSPHFANNPLSEVCCLKVLNFNSDPSAYKYPKTLRLSFVGECATAPSIHEQVYFGGLENEDILVKATQRLSFLVDTCT